MSVLYHDGEKVAGTFNNADGISYDNTSSGIKSTNVQDAVDELKANTDTIKNNLVWKSTTVWTTAYNNATTEILVRCVGKNSSGSEIAGTILIPKIDIQDTLRDYVDGFYLTADSYCWIHANVSKTTLSGAGIFLKGVNITTSNTFYYR